MTMTYRDPAPVQCESCLKQKQKSARAPMKKSTATVLKSFALLLVIEALVMVAIRVGMSVTRYGEGPTVAYAVTSFIAIAGFAGICVAAIFGAIKD
jgi:membrane protein YdbS with pleckstrin-like domain